MDATPDPFADGPINYERLIEFSSRERPVCTLVAMAEKNDPFYIRPGRRAKAEWFSALWREHCQHRGNMHTRGIHYVLISLKDRPDREGGGKPYVNTERCYNEMVDASRDARLLDLVPIDLIDDQRNDAPVEHLPNYSTDDNPDASLEVTEGVEPEVDIEPIETIDDPPPVLFTGDNPINRMRVLGLTSAPDQIDMPGHVEAPDVPDLEVEFDDKEDLVPKVEAKPPNLMPPWFHIEIWCEKTTMNGILLRLARERRLNVITGSGFQSLTGCWKLIKRAKRSGRPVRILYVKDFDKAGMHMPVAVARVIEMLLRREKLDLDIKLIIVALTHEQCVEYQLPRSPIDDGIGGKEEFEERFGEGATELDALETLHPGALRQILLSHIDRYDDPTFGDRVEEVHGELKEELDGIQADVTAPYQEALGVLIGKPQEIVDQRNAEVRDYLAEKLADLNERIADIAGDPIASINERLADVEEQAAEIDDEIERQYGERVVPLNEVLDQVRDEVEDLNAEVRRIGEEGVADVNRGIEAIDERYETQLSDVKERIREIQKEIRDGIETSTRDVLDGVEWPEPEEDDSVVPLFDSRRPYLEQMDHYKAHLGQATGRRPDGSGKGAKRKRVLKPREGST